jgi:nitrite reductase (NADH) small subunit
VTIIQHSQRGQRSLRGSWVPVCPAERIQPERGVAALLPGGAQAAVFRTHDGALYALANTDPFSGAAVLSRGIVGDRGGIPTVASPMHKQVFALETGVCLDDPQVAVPVFAVRQNGGAVEIAVPPSGR